MPVNRILELIRSDIYNLYIASCKKLHSNKVDPRILNWLGISPCVEKASLLHFVRWIAPSIGWAKLNCDGASKQGNPGHSGGDGIIRDHSRDLICAFGHYYGIHTSMSSEAMAVLVASKLLRVSSYIKFGWN